MLEFLPKRGPDAFDSFCDALHEDYPWVAKLLRESVETESERILAVQSKKDDIATEQRKLLLYQSNKDEHKKVSNLC
jgi:hypothetical protein